MPASSSEAAGVPLSFTEAYTRYAPYIAVVCWRATHDREATADLVQATFLAAWGKWATAPVEDPRGLRAWLTAVARYEVSHARQYARARKRGVTVPYAWWTDRRAHSDTPERIVLRRERVRRLAWGLTTCLPRERAIIAGRLAGRSYEEIADRLGCTPGAAKASIALARKRLRRLLDAG